MSGRLQLGWKVGGSERRGEDVEGAGSEDLTSQFEMIHSPDKGKMHMAVMIYVDPDNYKHLVCSVLFELHHHLARKTSVLILQRSKVKPGEDVVKRADRWPHFTVCRLLHSPQLTFAHTIG